MSGAGSTHKISFVKPYSWATYKVADGPYPRSSRRPCLLYPRAVPSYPSESIDLETREWHRKEISRFAFFNSREPAAASDTRINSRGVHRGRVRMRVPIVLILGLLAVCAVHSSVVPDDGKDFDYVKKVRNSRSSSTLTRIRVLFTSSSRK